MRDIKQEHPKNIAFIRDSILVSRIFSYFCALPLFDFTNTVNNFENEHEFEFLEPLFSDFPPVSHNYTLKLNLEWRIVFRAVLVELRQCKIICNDTSDATVLSESSPNFIQWMKIISQKKWTNCVISRKKLPRKSKVCNTFISYYSYEDRYDFSRWKKFTDKRPKTFLYSQGTIYTYEELPSFPVKRKKVEKKRPKRAKKKTVASTVVSPIAPVEVVPVVVSNSVPDSVPNTEPDPVSFISSAVCQESRIKNQESRIFFAL